MTRPIDFGEKFRQLTDIVKGSKEMSDVKLMEFLGFSPSSWKAWKPKFIEKIKEEKFEGFDETGKPTFFHIVYGRTSKKWKWIPVFEKKEKLSPYSWAIPREMEDS